MGGHVTTSLAEQLPVPVWEADTSQRRIARLGRRLAGRSHSSFSKGASRLRWPLYRIELAEFERIVNGFPLVANELRESAVEELRRIYEM